jgi:hypothetical protein
VLGVNDNSTDLLDVGDNVTVLGGILTPQCSSSSASDSTCTAVTPRQTVLVDPPVNPAIPQVVLLFPTVVSTCGDLVVDATQSVGGGGRDWTAIVWTVQSTDPAAANATRAIEAYLTTKGTDTSTRIVIPIGSIMDTSTAVPMADAYNNTYTFVIALSLTNYLVSEC